MNANIEELEITNCFGCAVCAKACPKQIIKTRINEYGFYEPYIISGDTCIRCGLCADVCSFHNAGLSLDVTRLDSFAGYSNNDSVRQRCSTGGVGFELAATALSQGYKVCAVRYNASNNIAEHFVASNIEELKYSVGSKYIQSDTLAGMMKMDINDKYILFGTPCHIDSFRRYLRKVKKESNFILVDFFCHGVPSYLLYHKYLDTKSQQTGKVKSVSWRDKTDGWHDSWVMDIRGEEGRVHAKLSDGDVFLKTFLSDSCLGKACYDNCKFKYRNSSADIRIGDAWGRLYQKDSKGVNAVICFTDKGHNLVKQSNCTLIDHDFDSIAEYQMKHNATRPLIFNLVWRLLKNDAPLDVVKLNRLLNINSILHIPGRIIKKTVKILR